MCRWTGISSIPDFFVYREDADVAWRAQLLGLALHLHARRRRLTTYAR